MRKFTAILKEERMLLLVAYCLSLLNNFIVIYVNTILLTNQKEVVLKWLPVIRTFSSISAILTIFALILFIMKKVPKYKWVGYAMLIMSVMSTILMGINADWFINTSSVYIALTLIHMFLNLTIAYLIISFQFCSKKIFNVVIALKFINKSLLMGMPIIASITGTSTIQMANIILMNLDSMLKFAVIVILIISLLYKPNQRVIEDHQ